MIDLYYQPTVYFLFVPLFHFPSFSVFFCMKWLIFWLHFLFSPSLLALTLYFVVQGLTVYMFNLLQSTFNTYTQYSIKTLQSYPSISPFFTFLLLLSCILRVLQTLYCIAICLNSQLYLNIFKQEKILYIYPWSYHFWYSSFFYIHSYSISLSGIIILLFDCRRIKGLSLTFVMVQVFWWWDFSAIVHLKRFYFAFIFVGNMNGH